MSWFKEFQNYIWFASIIVGAVLFAYTTFATNESVKSYVDEKTRPAEERLERIERMVERIDQRVYEMGKK